MLTEHFAHEEHAKVHSCQHVLPRHRAEVER
jgi:hypothetical protein